MAHSRVSSPPDNTPVRSRVGHAGGAQSSEGRQIVRRHCSVQAYVFYQRGVHLDRLAAKFQGLYVPFKGAPEVLTEIMGGRLDFYLSPATAALPSVAASQLQALAVASAKRADALPKRA
jgi:Tripartite tricarboxylate transporter family receptor